MAVRIKDIAEKAGVSEGAVRKALHGYAGTARVGKETTKKIRDIAAQMRYRPNLVARQLAGGQNRVIGVIIDSIPPSVHLSRLDAIEAEVAKYEYRLIVGQSHGEASRVENYLRDFAGRRIDALLYVSHHGNNPQVDDVLTEWHRDFRTIVFIGRVLGDISTRSSYSVNVDRAEGIRLAVEHLLDRGKSRVGLIINKNLGYTTQQRLDGYTQAMSARNMEVKPGLIQYLKSAKSIDQRVAPVVDTLINDHHVDAIIAHNDYFAFAAINQLRRMNLRVPQDVAVIGFDNIEAAELFYPPLTTIDQNVKLTAKTAIRMLMDLLEDKKVRDRHIQLSPKLVVRESS